MEFVYVTTEREDVGLLHAAGQENARRAGRVRPEKPLTTEEYFRAVVAAVLESYACQCQEAEVEAVRAWLESATPQQREAILSAVWKAAK
jgi:hypothetical protein